MGLTVLLRRSVNHLGVDLTAALKNAEDDCLTFAASTLDRSLPSVCVHVASFAADEGFIYFDLALPSLPAFLKEPDCMARRMRCIMNHADFWVTPRAR